MDSVLVRIRRLVQSGRFRFSLKAEMERLRDGLSEEDVVESIRNADRIEKTIRSTSPWRRKAREMLYVIHAPTDSGTWIYTKGTIRDSGDVEEFYFLVSSKMVE